MDVSKIKDRSDCFVKAAASVIVGKDEEIRLLLTALYAGGHVLIEDLPGTGKTMLARTVSALLSGEMRRIQFTPDLMPSDVTGLNIYNQKSGEFVLVKGPVFTDILLADEINRATPRTQSALLEAMQERQVTIDGERLPLSDTFMVIATQNPVETTGTYPLPEAQLDRFTMKLSLGRLSEEEEMKLIDRFMNDEPLERLESVMSSETLAKIQRSVKEVHVHKECRRYIIRLANATRESSGFKNGVSGRAVLAMVACAQSYAAIKGRDFVTPDDIKYLVPFVWAHRLAGSGLKNESTRLLDMLVSGTEVPVEEWSR